VLGCFRLPIGNPTRAARHFVRVRGFEPPTPCSRSRCASRLRHTRIMGNAWIRTKLTDNPDSFGPPKWASFCEPGVGDSSQSHRTSQEPKPSASAFPTSALIWNRTSFSRSSGERMDHLCLQGNSKVGGGFPPPQSTIQLSVTDCEGRPRMVSGAGFEPTFTASETAVLPVRRSRSAGAVKPVRR
jgi:hypothetical protein